jgi:iron complex transport system substrate-binding protein
VLCPCTKGPGEKAVLLTQDAPSSASSSRQSSARIAMAVPQRIVSLLPSSTEVLCALGLETSLVGISHVCDYPLGVTSLPRLTTPSSSKPGEQPTPDREAALIQAGLSIYQLDLDLLRTLQPDLIVTQDRAAVCGSSYAEILEAARHVLGRHVEVLSLHPTFLQDIWDDIHRVGEATQQQQQAATLLTELFARVNTVVAESIMLREPPRVALLVWTDPLMLSGYWCPDLIQLAGGADGLCRPGAPAPVVEWGRLQEYAPEVLLVSPCGSPLAQTRAALPLLQGLPGWDDLPAVRQGYVYAMDGQGYLHRPGPRIVDSLETLAGLLHPDLFGEFLPQEGELYCRVTT